jgi:hypothetical protein
MSIYILNENGLCVMMKKQKKLRVRNRHKKRIVANFTKMKKTKTNKYLYKTSCCSLCDETNT